MEQYELAESISALEDKQALQELTHSYLLAADRKDNVKMSAHFTSDGVLTSIMPDSTIRLEGRQGISDGFAHILAPISVAHHLSGQLLLTVAGNNATGTSYAFVTLIGEQQEGRYVRKIWAVYNDEYSKEGGKWLISKRIATVAWEEKKILN